LPCKERGGLHGKILLLGGKLDFQNSFLRGGKRSCFGKGEAQHQGRLHGDGKNNAPETQEYMVNSGKFAAGEKRVLLR